MGSLFLHEFHHHLDARFAELNGTETVNDYGDWLAEHAALRQSVGVLDLSGRSRICLTGADRVRFLHGQVTNDVKKLRVGDGCYAAITTNKGKMESDLNIFCLADELLLDFEPGLTEKISQRLEKFIVADDVQIVNVVPQYGLLSVQGPEAEQVVRAIGLFGWGERPREPHVQANPDGSSGASPHPFPVKALDSVKISDATLGEIYLMNHARLFSSPLPAKRGEGQGEGQHFTSSPRPSPPFHGREGENISSGFDLFVPNPSLGAVADKLIAAAKQIGGLVAPKQSEGGRACGWQAFETARIEAGIPRFGLDMDETNIPLECGIENRAVSYNKGCYVGQEVINRIHSVGHVTRELRGLRLADPASAGLPLPQRGDKLFHNGKEIGFVTSAVKSPMLNANIALGYIRREANQIGTELVLRTVAGESSAKIVEIPFLGGSPCQRP
ncbi:MAG TPA: glycine cleavage T C-terminal barrel domain-containing protein [Verrucomicrobiae bacterium]|nr:glycine cleavage T C-terminal barrel domain-containing protein [Verrucomicrobiae bacterium]